MPPPPRRLALRLRPDIVYASDPLGAVPGLLAARLARARLVYHEHDSPAPGSLRPSLARSRAAAARRAELVIFPNEARARIAQAELGYPADRLRIVWNMPRRAELPPLDSQPPRPAHALLSRQHLAGSSSSDVVEAVRRARRPRLPADHWLRSAGRSGLCAGGCSSSAAAATRRQEIRRLLWADSAGRSIG